MKLFGITLRSPFAVERKDTLVDSPRWWSRIGSTGRSGALNFFQHNVECDEPKRLFANSVIYACISRIANDCAKMPPELKERVGGIWRVVDRPSPYWPVLRKPNEYQTRIQFFVVWLMSLLSAGNTYVLKERDGRNIVVGLHILNPRQVEIHVSDRGEVFYKLRFDKDHMFNGVLSDIAVPASEIIHDLINPLFHPLCGIPPLYAAGMAATQAGRIQADTTRLFENGGRPSGLVIAPNDIDEDEARRWKQEWKDNFTGSNRGSVAFMSGGMKYEPITQSAEESQMIELLRWTAEDIARPYGVPLYKINAGPMPVSNNVQVLNAQYYSETLQSRIEAIEVLLDEGLGLPQDMGVEFNLDILLRMDSATQIDVLGKAVGAALMSIDEGRQKLDLPAVTGGNTPYLQQQNYSLAALAKRDALDDPFATAKPAAPVATPDAANDEDIAAATRSYLEQKRA